jgi:hypothetical protein
MMQKSPLSFAGNGRCFGSNKGHEGHEGKATKATILKLEAHGWYEVRQTGSHKQFRHDDRPGLVTVPHPKKEPSAR